MDSNVVPFRNPDLPLEALERLVARRKYREGCKVIAAKTVAQAFAEAVRLPGVGKLGAEDAYPLFVAAMRRELRKMGLF